MLRPNSVFQYLIYSVLKTCYCNLYVTYSVAEQTSSGSPVVQRIRLHEQAENKDSGAGSLMDDDLLQYYEFLADKGDIQAQV